MKNKIIEKVNECLEQWHGGEIFFDKLDEMMKFDKEILIEFIEMIEDDFCKIGVRSIASGELGLCLHNYGIPVDVLVQGGLRNGKQILNLEDFIEKGREYLFIDDSYFSGKTSNKIKTEVERCGGKFVGTYVIYDGSKEKDENVKSVYRYYDHHTKEGLHE